MLAMIEVFNFGWCFLIFKIQHFLLFQISAHNMRECMLGRLMNTSLLAPGALTDFKIAKKPSLNAHCS